MIKHIISGGQTGADLGGLVAGLLLQIPTGGHIPKGFRTENGPTPILGKLYNLQETRSDKYPERTTLNVKNSDATIWFGNTGSPGYKLTKRVADEKSKPFFVVPYPADTIEENLSPFLEWLDRIVPNTINIAGNRESKNPGIQKYTTTFLIEAFAEKNGFHDKRTEEFFQDGTF